MVEQHLSDIFLEDCCVMCILGLHSDKPEYLIKYSEKSGKSELNAYL